MEHEDVRAKILKDAYDRGTKGQPVLSSPIEYARLLGIPEEQATFNVKYLINANLLDGQVLRTINLEVVNVTGITNQGIEAVEDPQKRGSLNVNWAAITLHGDFTQISIGSTNSPQGKVDKSPNATTTVGDDNVVRIGGFQPVEVNPYPQGFFGTLRWGKLITRSLFHTLDHDTSALKWISGGLGVVFAGTVILAYLRGTSLLLNPVVGILLVADLVVAGVFWETAAVGEQTKCPKCNNRFSFIRVKRTLMGQADTPDIHTDNYNDEYLCSNCGYAEKRSSREQVDKQTEE